MYTIFAAAALAAGVLGLIFANLYRPDWRARGRALREAGLWPVWLLSLAAILLAFLATLPSAPPFAAGLTLGWGMLIGGVLGLYALLESAGTTEGEAWIARAVGLLSAAVIGPSLTLLLFRGYPTEALAGCALGAVLAAGVAGGILRARAAAAEAHPAGAAFRGVELYALATVAVVVGARLGIARFPRVTLASGHDAYWVFPALALAAGVLLVILLAGSRRPALWSGIAASAGVVIVAAALGAKLLPHLAWPPPLFGLVAFTLAGTALVKQERASSPASHRPAALAFGLALLTLAVMAAAFSMRGMHGYGQSLVLLGALPIAAALSLGASREREPLAGSLVMGAFTIALLLVLYRVYLEGAGRGWTLGFQEQYNLFSLLLGAGAGFGVMTYLARGTGRLPLLVLRTVVLGLALAAAPLALAALWGAKATGAFLAGLISAEVMWMLLAAWVAGDERRRTLLAAPHLFLVGAALVAVQGTPLVLAQEFTRSGRLLLVLAIAAVGMAWVVLDSLAKGDDADRVTG